MLDDLVRMSSSAVYSGEPSQTQEVVEFEDREASRRPVSQNDLKLAASHHEFATMTLNSRRYPIKKLSVETCVRYLNISYCVSRHMIAPPFLVHTPLGFRRYRTIPESRFT